MLVFSGKLFAIVSAVFAIAVNGSPIKVAMGHPRPVPVALSNSSPHKSNTTQLHSLKNFVPNLPQQVVIPYLYVIYHLARC